MGCDCGSYDVGNLDAGREDIAISATPFENRYLFFSDNPEKITLTHPTNGAGVLWLHEFQATQHHQFYRAYLWHVNQTGSDRRVGFTVQNLSAIGDLIVGELVAYKLSANRDDGKLLACAALQGSLGLVGMKTVPPGEVVVVDDKVLGDGDSIGAMYEFTMHHAPPNQPPQMHYKIRAAVDPTDIRNQTANEPCPAVTVPPGNVDARGTWPQCAIDVTMNTAFDVSGADKILMLCAPDDPPHAHPDRDIFTAAKSLDFTDLARSLIGLYGVDYKDIHITAQNPTGNQRTVRVRVAAIQDYAISTYAGAGWKGGTAKLIPDLNKTTQTDCARIFDFNVPAGQTASDSFRLQHAGAAILEVGVHMHTIE